MAHEVLPGAKVQAGAQGQARLPTGTADLGVGELGQVSGERTDACRATGKGADEGRGTAFDARPPLAIERIPTLPGGMHDRRGLPLRLEHEHVVANVVIVGIHFNEHENLLIRAARRDGAAVGVVGQFREGIQTGAIEAGQTRLGRRTAVRAHGQAQAAVGQRRSAGAIGEAARASGREGEGPAIGRAHCDFSRHRID